MNQQHKIVRQTLDLHVLENKDVYNLQTKVRDVYYEQLLPILNAQFDEIAPEGTTVKIDRLEIDLGEINVHALDYSLKQELEQIVAEYVQPIKLEIQAGRKEGSLPVRSGEENIEWSLEASEMHLLEGLKVFLKTGVLPWGIDKALQEQNSNQLGSAGLIEFCMQEYPTQISRFLQENYQARSIQQRVFHHFTIDQIREVLRLVHATELKISQQELQTLINEVLTVSNTSIGEASDTMKSIWWHIFVALLEVPKTTDKTSLLLPAISWALKSEEIQHFTIARVFEKWSESPLALPTLKKQLELAGVPVALVLKNQNWIASQVVRNANLPSATEALIGTLGKRQNILLTRNVLASELKAFTDIWEQFVKQSKEETTTTAKEIEQLQLQLETLEAASKKVDESTDIVEESAAEDLKKSLEEGIAVNNAGLIILSTYLPFLFDHLGWLDEERMLRTDTQEKALALTHFLVYNDEEIDESQLTLNKVLLGIDLEEPIVNNYQLSEEEKAEGLNLLEVVVERWEALGKGTTPGGLQISFLQRSGLLYLQDDQFLLRVERKTLDILLDRIPWTIATVKLNWMDKILMTEW